MPNMRMTLGLDQQRLTSTWQKIRSNVFWLVVKFPNDKQLLHSNVESSKICFKRNRASAKRMKFISCANIVSNLHLRNKPLCGSYQGGKRRIIFPTSNSTLLHTLEQNIMVKILSLWFLIWKKLNHFRFCWSRKLYWFLFDNRGCYRFYHKN